jgi:hypothetical protein
MTEYRTVAMGKHCGHPQCPFAEPEVPDGVDAGVNSPQTAKLHPMRNRTSPEAKRCQLPPRDHSVLPRRKVRYFTFPSSCLHGVTKLGNVSISPRASRRDRDAA